jgi:hypothetical protein
MKSISPWPAKTRCPEDGADEFIKWLNQASYHNAGLIGEMSSARECIYKAAQVAIDQDWPYWVIDRVFRETGPLVEFGSFMQAYINILTAKRGGV